MDQIFCRLISQRYLLFHLLVAHIVNLSVAACAVTLPCPANGLTVSQPVTAWEAGNAESMAAPHFIAWPIILAAFKGKNLNLGAVFVTYINHISLISFEMKQEYKNIPISTNNNSSSETMRLS